MTAFEKVLVAADRNPFSAIYRAGMGFVFIPLLSALHFDTRSTTRLLIALLTLLFLYRVSLIVVRKVLRFSSEMNATWAERRELAKRFDCYQWQKLFFVGLGIAGYIFVSREFVVARVVVSALCIVSGLIGLMLWMTIGEKVRSGLVNKYAL